MQKINVFQTPELGLSVSGRELFTLIAAESSKSDRDMFSDWFRQRQKKFNLVEGTDFLTRKDYPNPDNGRHLIEFTLSIAVAKRIAKVQLRRKGMPVLNYLTEYEAKFAQSAAAAIESPTLSFDVHPQQEDPTLTLPQPPSSSAQPLSKVQQLLKEAQQLAEQEAQDRERGNQYEERLQAVEAKLDTLLSLFHQATIALMGTAAVKAMSAQGPGAPQPESKREKINRLVNGFAAANNYSYQQVWRMLYGQLNTDYQFDAWRHLEPGKDNYLDVVEKHGQLDNMLAIASKRLAIQAQA